MKQSVLAIIVIGFICGVTQTYADNVGATAKDADEFIARVNHELQIKGPEWAAAAWVAANYVTEDTELLATKASAESIEFITRILGDAKRFDNVQGLSAATKRALMIIKLRGATDFTDSTALAPNDPKKREELASLSARMKAAYSTAKWCRKDPAGNQQCLPLQDISKILRNDDGSHTPKELSEAWVGWYDNAKSSRNDYQRFVALANEGARENGFADNGSLWRSGYDMNPEQFTTEVERLWKQVEPLYKELHCYTRNKLNAKYGDAVVSKSGPIPAHMLGNMWAQDWSGLYPLLEPYPGVVGVDVTAVLKAKRDDEYKTLRNAFKGTPSVVDQADMEHVADTQVAKQMIRIAEDFYTSLGMPVLPSSFWENSTLVKPRDREMECHPTAWDFDSSKNDVRLKQCIEPDEDSLFAVHHELGHVYYYINYHKQPLLFQIGAHDGFHEAIGDTITLSLTPQHLVKIGLLKSTTDNQQALINAQMKKALEKIAFLPFAKMVDQWRWQVFAGKTSPESFNHDWWRLVAKYQGVVPPVARDESNFDPAAKYHVASNTPYVRYFMSFVIQFQFQKALCDAAGYKGELATCDIYGNKAAGNKFMTMLSRGASQPWQDTLYELTGSRQMDASALVEYFHPLMGYLKEQNKGQKCGW